MDRRAIVLIVFCGAGLGVVALGSGLWSAQGVPVPPLEVKMEAGLRPGSVVFPEAGELALPEGSVPLEAGGIGILSSEDGSAQGMLRLRNMRCDDASLLRIETDGGTFLVGVPGGDAWGCRGALAQWRSTNPVDTIVGLRYSDGAGGDEPALTLLTDARGGSLNMRVIGAWRALSAP